MAVTIRPAIGFVHAAQRRAGEDFERTWTVLGHDFSSFSGFSGRAGGEELEGMLIDGTLIDGTLTVGAEETLIEGLATIGGVLLESSIDMALMGIRSSSRGSGLLFPDLGAAGNGLTTPVVQKSFLLVGLLLPSCVDGISSGVSLRSSRPADFGVIRQPVELSDFAPGTGGNVLFAGDCLPFATPTSTYPAFVLPLPYLSFKARTRGVDPRSSESSVEERLDCERVWPLVFGLLRKEAR